MSSDSPEKAERYFPQFYQEGNKLNLSGQRITKVPKHARPAQLPKITQLLLDNNELHRFDNLQQYSSVIEFSASHNEIYRMYQVSSLKHLVRLDLSHNTILSIEGLRDLVHLTYLNLSHNKIKIIDQLHTNLQLEHLDLSENAITVISNVSHMSKLKKLYLHKNAISVLKHCGVYLPGSLETLTLAYNKITDLNEVSHLAGLISLVEISIALNPCVQMTGNEPGFDYRPFLINWCGTLKVIDGFTVDDIERLKGEWLYSQGRGRQFRPGQHAALCQYLAETCSLNDQNLQTEHERKLELILSKARHHQSQLRLADKNPKQPAGFRGGIGTTRSSPFLVGLMTQSLDPSLLDSCSMQITDSVKPGPSQRDHSLTRSLICDPPSAKDEDPVVGYSQTTAPLPAASKLVPVPESLISPMVTSTPPLVTHTASCSSTDLNSGKIATVISGPYGDNPSRSKLVSIKSAAEKKKVKRSHGSDREQAAICIQKMWRGFRTRNLNPRVLTMYHQIQIKRTNQYIRKLSQEMEATRAALDSGHKLQILQMQAINALWKKVVTSQDPAKTSELAQQCDRLAVQVQQLQTCMEEVLRCVSRLGGNATSTQTDIIAVRTPHEGSDAKFLHSRPSTLPIPPQQVSQFADRLVVGAIADSVEDGSSKDETPKQDVLDTAKPEVNPLGSSMTHEGSK